MQLAGLLTLLTLSFALACSGDSDQNAASTPVPFATSPATPRPEIEQPPAPVIEPPRRPPPDRAPVTAISTEVVLADGAEVPFKVCSQRAGWQRPGPEEMTPVFQDRRFGDGAAPYPLEYTYYLRDFHFPTAFSASVNKYWVAFGGFSTVAETEPPEVFCDLQGLRAQGFFRMVRTLNYSIVEVKRLNTHFVIVVERSFDSWQDAVLPFPPMPLQSTDEDIEVSRIVDTSGRTLFEEATPANPQAWFQTVQYAASGELEFVMIGGILPYAATTLTIPEDQPALRLYSASPAESDIDGSLVAIDGNGVEAGRIEWHGHYDMWKPLDTLALEPGTYTLRFDDDAQDWRHFVLLADGVPLPPGADD